MEEVGVEAVVKGLTSFLGDIRRINSGLDSIRPHATLLQKAFGGVRDFLGNMGRELLNIVEFTLGSLLADAINFVIGKIGELVTATLDAGNEFQALELRLNRLNFNDLIESGSNYNDATLESIKLTKEQLEWLQKLAAQTPYDNTDISNIFTLARSYGFASDKAQGITEDVANFAAGMGLGNTEIERIIVNFGQMVQLGQVTQRELNDLARGSFVPVNDVLLEMQKQTGLTGAEFEDFLKTTEGVDAFMKAFSTTVETRFAGAADAMARTFGAASANALDIVKSIGGLNIVKPILDVVGAKIADFVDQFTKDPERWDRIVDAATRVGEAVVNIVNDLFDLLPSTEGIADGLISSLEGVATWLTENREEIVAFFVGVGDSIKNDIIPFIRDELIPAVQTFVQFLIDHKTEIMEWGALLLKLFIAWQLIATVLNIVANVVISFIGFLLSLIGVISTISTIVKIGATAFQFLGGILAGLGPIILVIIAIIGTLVFWIGVTMASLNVWKTGIPIILDFVVRAFEGFKNLVANTMLKVIAAIRNGDWFGAGMALVQGIMNGITSMAGALLNLVGALAQNAVDAVKSVFMGNAPTLQINATAGAPAGVMAPSMAPTYIPASRSTTSNVTSTNNFNLAVHSKAGTANVIQDFSLLQSLRGSGR